MPTSVIARARPFDRVPGRPVRALSNHPVTQTLPLPASAPRKFDATFIHQQIRACGFTEDVLIHEQDYRQFIAEKGITELGRGSEGAVYFLRGHVVKVENAECAPWALREIIHMLQLNPIRSGGAMGERGRNDWPALLWVYLLSNGGIAIGMKPFDAQPDAAPGATLYERLHFGPSMTRTHVLHALYSIAHSLVYAHGKGIVHHDLKPANMYIPSDAAQAPVVFDLGQALWRHSGWGRGWLKHEHNLCYWYNGTYRYMHHRRRMAHLAASARVRQLEATPAQAEAFTHFQPSFYDDVFAFARIVRDVAGSSQTGLLPSDRTALRAFYQRLMGLERRSMGRNRDSGIVSRLKSMFNAPASPDSHQSAIEHRWPTMEAVVPELEGVLTGLLGVKFHK